VYQSKRFMRRKLVNESEIPASSERTSCHHPTGRNKASPGATTTSSIDASSRTSAREAE